MTDPTDVVALDDVRLHTGASELTVLVATETQVRDHLTRVWSLSEDSTDVTTYFDEIDAGVARGEDGGASADDAPTVRLVNMVLADAVRAGASDIHLEPQRETLRVRYRVDGVLRDVMSVPRSAMASVVSRLKIVSGLDIAERRLPQDGRTRITSTASTSTPGSSTLPSIHGEKVVVRLLARADQIPPLDGLGLEPDQLARPAARPVGRRRAWCSSPARPAPARPARSTPPSPTSTPPSATSSPSRTRSRCRWPASPRSRCTSAAG